MKKYILGNAVLITSVLSSIPTSMKITIIDSAGQTLVNKVSMSATANNVYTYVFQSAEINNAGTYRAVIEGTVNNYTSVGEIRFEMIQR